jgi:16S rRNA C967 or C1407 C5-methylase (RsmB/RsmF family)
MREYLHALDAAAARIERLTQELERIRCSPVKAYALG